MSLRKQELDNGFSLVELMVAVFIMTFGLLAAAPLMVVTMGMDTLAGSKSAATMAAQNELERLADLFRRNPAAAELTIGEHQADGLSEVRNPLTQKVLNMYKITWFVSDIPDPRPGTNLPGRIISVRATPMLTESLENTHTFRNKSMILNVVIAAEP